MKCSKIDFGKKDQSNKNLSTKNQQPGPNRVKTDHKCCTTVNVSENKNSELSIIIISTPKTGK